MKLLQTKNEINVDNLGKIKILIIKYSGSFTAEIIPDAFVSINKKKLTIVFNSTGNNDTLMYYYGNLNIREVKAILKTGGIVKVRKVTKSDIVNKITSKWSTSTMEYTDYNQSLGYSGSQETLISYTYKGDRVYKNYKNEYIENINQTKSKKLNKIRGNYVVK